MTSATATDFEYLQKTFAIDDVEGMTNALHEDGFALVPGVLCPEEVQTARNEIDRLKPFGFDMAGENYYHFKNVFNRDPYWLQFLDKEGIVDLAESTMGEECHIIGQTAWRSGPNRQSAPNMHIDQIFAELPDDFFENYPDFRMPIYISTAHYYLSDITEDLCPTWVVPGSHKSCRRPREGEHSFNGKEAQPVLCKAGDVLFFRSEVWHSGSTNKTEDSWRYLLQVHYSHRMIHQKFSPYLEWSFSPHILGVANPRQRRLMGEHKRRNYD